MYHWYMDGNGLKALNMKLDRLQDELLEVRPKRRDVEILKEISETENQIALIERQAME